MKGRDWRKDYVICPHVELEGDYRHEGFRVCCQTCYEKGFLFGELKTKTKDGQAIGNFKQNKKEG